MVGEHSALSPSRLSYWLAILPLRRYGRRAFDACAVKTFVSVSHSPSFVIQSEAFDACTIKAFVSISHSPSFGDTVGERSALAPPRLPYRLVTLPLQRYGRRVCGACAIKSLAMLSRTHSRQGFLKSTWRSLEQRWSGALMLLQYDG